MYNFFRKEKNCHFLATSETFKKLLGENNSPKPVALITNLMSRTK
jgi:hypothetical protein